MRLLQPNRVRLYGPVWPFPIYLDCKRANNTAPTLRSAGQSLIGLYVLSCEHSYSIRGIACHRQDP